MNDNNVPPSNYICRICNTGGHWIKHCPMKQNIQYNNNNNNKPPNGYKCRICNSSDHFIQNCPSNTHNNKQNMQYNYTNNSNNNKPPNGYKCRICNNGDHFIQNCPLKNNNNQKPPLSYICRICNIGGDHYINNCPSKNNNNNHSNNNSNHNINNKPPSSYQCYKCNIIGAHFIQNCPSNNGPPSNYICNACGIKGHFYANCPSLKLQNNNNGPNRQNNNNKNKKPNMNYCCNICKIKGDHFINDCPSKNAMNTKPPQSYTCNICKMSGDHYISNCPSKFSRNNGLIPGNSYICNICKMSGDHWIDNCPKKVKPKLPENYICKLCNKSGHWFNECVLFNKNNNHVMMVPKDYICNICKIKGKHLINNCPSKGIINNKPPQSYMCRICHVSGDHYISNCPSKLSTNNGLIPGDSYTCNICNISGDHWIGNCPQKVIGLVINSSVLERLQRENKKLQKVKQEAIKKLIILQKYKKQKTICWKWQWRENDGEWNNYDQDICEKLEHLQINSKYVYTANNNQQYELTKKTINIGQQINVSSNVKRSIRRIQVEDDDDYDDYDDASNFDDQKENLDRVQYPKWWNMSHVKNSNYGKPILITLDLNENEIAKKVAAAFKKTAGHKSIIKIESIQNQMLYDKYWSEKRTLTKLIGYEKLNEKYLFHGTTIDKTMSFIMQGGFRKVFNNAAMYGKGTYFAGDAAYSVAYSSNNNGIYKMFQCKVICGESSTGNSSYELTQWPKKSNGFIYDTLVNTLINPSIFVIHENARAYPMFVIHFK